MRDFRERRGIGDDYDRYGFAALFPSTAEEDKAAVKIAKKEVRTYYSLYDRSCNHLAQDVLQAAGIKIGGSPIPHLFFMQTTDANSKSGERGVTNVTPPAIGRGNGSLYQPKEDAPREIRDRKRDELQRLLDATGGFDKNTPRCRTK